MTWLCAFYFLVSCLMCVFASRELLYPQPEIPSMRSRHDFGYFLQSHGEHFKIGAEIGVKEGEYSQIILSRWENCVHYYLVDIWKQQKNYEDTANLNDQEQEKNYVTTRKRLKRWEHKTHFLKMYSKDAAEQLTQNLTQSSQDVAFFDFIYIDARHDYCGCKEDLELWYPLLKPGGIFAGDDYSPHYPPSWDICGNGTSHPGSVYAAVNEFAKEKGFTVQQTTHGWRNWIARKPLV